MSGDAPKGISSLDSFIEELSSSYLPEGMFGFVPVGLVDRQYGWFEALRFFGSQIVVVNNRLCKNLEGFNEWGRVDHPLRISVSSDAWFLVELYFQAWKILTNIPGFKRSSFSYMDEFSKFAPLLTEFRNHRQHISDGVTKILDKPVWGSIVWFQHKKLDNIEIHQLTLDSDLRWNPKMFAVPKLPSLEPVGSLTLLLGDKQLDLSMCCKLFKHAAEQIYTALALILHHEIEQGSKNLQPGFQGHTVSWSMDVEASQETGELRVSLQEEARGSFTPNIGFDLSMHVYNQEYEYDLIEKDGKYEIRLLPSK